MTTSPSNQKPVAIVTGAAGGIGRAISHLLAQKGYRIALSDINQSVLEQVKNELGEAHLLFQTDVTNLDQVRKMVQHIINKTGRIDVLINNAG